jgi:hypothetical protein
MKQLELKGSDHVLPNDQAVRVVALQLAIEATKNSSTVTQPWVQEARAESYVRFITTGKAGSDPSSVLPSALAGVKQQGTGPLKGG